MTMFCKQCGNQISGAARFCPSCGAALNVGEAQVLPSESSAPSQSGNAGNAGLIGFSAHCDSPEILAAAEKNRKSNMGCMWILAFAPLAVLTILGLLVEELPMTDALVIGGGIAVFVLIISLFVSLSGRRPMWEGTVERKYSKEKSERISKGSSDYRRYTAYFTVFSGDDGTKRSVQGKDDRRVYDYFAVGDRVRYHPRFGAYEKYDKSKDRIIYCIVCKEMNPIQNDRCKKCGNLLFK